MLSEDEKQLDRYLAAALFDARQKTPFPYSHSFLRTRPLIDSSPLLPFVQRIPKGAALHMHFASAADYDWLVV